MRYCIFSHTLEILEHGQNVLWRSEVGTSPRIGGKVAEKVQAILGALARQQRMLSAVDCLWCSRTRQTVQRGVERDALQLVDGARERANDWEELERTRSRAVAGTRRG